MLQIRRAYIWGELIFGILRYLTLDHMTGPGSVAIFLSCNQDGTNLK